MALLDCAMEAFWTRGYDRTSIRELVGKTGVNRASLYGAYPDKRTRSLRVSDVIWASWWKTTRAPLRA
ncbi:MAG: helix-turn-helix domain-containing protein [Burkholderiales bacterium]